MKSYCPNFKIISFVIFFFGLFGLAKSCWAATYYIDYTNGSNSNDGTSPSTPFKASPGDINNSEAAYTGRCTGNCASVTLAAGDMIYFKKGVSYVGRIEVDSAGLQTATGTHGSVTAGGVFTDADEPFASVRAGHYIFIYHAQSEVRNESSNGSDPQYVESVGLWKVASVDSNSRISLSGFNGIAHRTANMHYKVVNPITFTVQSEWGTGDAVIDANNAQRRIFSLHSDGYIRIDSLTFKNTTLPTCLSGSQEFTDATADGAIVQGPYHGNVGIQVVNCKFSNIANNAIGWMAQYAVISGNMFTSIGGHCVFGSEGNGLIENNVMNGSMRGMNSFGRYDVFRYNTVKNMRSGFCGWHADGIGPIQSGATDRNYAWVYGNTFENNSQHIYVDYNYCALGCDYQVFCNNTFINYTGSGTNCNGDTGSGDVGLIVGRYAYVLNNTFWASPVCSEKWNFYGPLEVGNNNLTVRNNLFINRPTMNWWNYDSYKTGTTFDYNAYYDASIEDVSHDNDSDPTWNLSQWQALGYDTHGPHAGGTAMSAVNPYVANESVLAYDLHLTASTPVSVKTGGSNLSMYFTLDKDKKARSSWSLGAYEYVQTGDTTIPDAPTGLSVK